MEHIMLGVFFVDGSYKPIYCYIDVTPDDSVTVNITPLQEEQK